MLSTIDASREAPGVRGKNGCYIVRPVQAGQKFNRLTAVEFIRIRNGNPGWLCRCDCGKERRVIEWSLWTGHVKSCGCYRDEVSAANGRASAKHNQTHTRIWETWRHMRERCEKPTHKSWKDYGGRGIKVCDRWQAFASFYADMGDPPSRSHSLDRIDPNRGYEPGNCRWATWAQQGENKRNTRRLTAFGETLTIKNWAAHPLCKPSWATLCARINGGWSAERAISTPVRHMPPRQEWNTNG